MEAAHDAQHLAPIALLALGGVSLGETYF